MKNKLSHFRLFLSCLILLILATASVFSQEKFDVKNTQAILISVTSEKMHDEPKPNGDEAALITDKDEIAKFVRLFDGNQKSVLHACGYQWRITFVRNSAEPFDIWFNQKCEQFERNTAEICETVQSKFAAIKKNPAHFVTEIGIDVNTLPDEAIARISENPNFKVFVLGDLDKRFPFVEIESKAVSEIPEDRRLWNKAKEDTRRKAEQILLNESKLISQKFAVLKNGRIELGMSICGGGKIEENLKMKVFFPVGTNLENIEKILTDTKFLKKEEPKVYFLQIVSKNKFSDSFGRKLTNEFPFIRETSVYTSYPR